MAETILIVDDGKENRDFIIEYVLEPNGFKYLTAKDGLEGLQMALKHKPDLILLDGGEGHVATVKPVIDRYGLGIPVFGLVKDDHHRTRAIALSGGEIAIQQKRAAYTLLSTIQEEVHRFAITFHRQQRKKNSISSSLLGIDGIGPTRAKELLRRFGSLKNIRQASMEELLSVKGMTRPAAEALQRALGTETSPQDE